MGEPVPTNVQRVNQSCHANQSMVVKLPLHDLPFTKSTLGVSRMFLRKKMIWVVPPLWWRANH